MSVINVENLTHYYGRRVGVDRISFAVPEGVLFGFLGPNGAGKSTTIRLLMGFLRQAGAARMLGQDCWRKSHMIKRDVGYLPGDVRLYPWLDGHRALRLVGQARGRDLTKAGRQLADRFNLELDVPVRRMSRGMRQKLGLIMTLASSPRVLVLDEPTSGLDPIMQARLGDHLRELAQAGHTVLFSSHTLSEVEQLCTHVAIVRSGSIVADTTLAALASKARRHVRIAFVDTAAAAVEAPAFLQDLVRDGVQWKAELTGPSGEFVRWAATKKITDLSVSPPDLENLFHEFYREGGGD